MAEMQDSQAQCDEHENREAEHFYEDGTQWCEECHVANLDAAAAVNEDH